jgi:diguanylate cyclase (GGDEF)-like protein
MGLRRLILVVLLGTLTVLALLTLAALRWDTQQKAIELEKVEAESDLRRLVGMLQATSLEVNGVLKSWANWTELYDHFAKPNPKFTKDELNPEALAVGGLHFLVLLDLGGKVFQMSEVPSATGELPATQMATQNARAFSDYFQRVGNSNACGIMLANTQLAMVCHSPMLNSGGKGPPHGYILIGRWINDAMIQHISEMTGVVFKLVPGASAGPQTFTGSKASNLLTPEAVGVSEYETHLELRYPVTSIFDRSIAEVQMTSPRKHAQAAQRSYNTTQAVVIALILICGVVLVLLLDVLVVRRINRLHTELGRIVESKEWTGRITVKGQDELTALARYTHDLIGIVRDQVQELKNLSATDSLTGLPNRRAFSERLEHLLAQHARQQLSAALILIDVDHFKKYNDRYGHPAGDEALKKVAQCLRSVLRREIDMPARMGGEEFGVLLEDCNLEQAQVAAEQLRTALEILAIEHLGLPVPGVMTISLGIAVMLDADTSDALYHRADKALYLAKVKGRNQWVAG